MTDLSLISIEDMMKEIESRCICVIAAYTLREEESKNHKMFYGNGQWAEAVKLASILNNDVLNNWDEDGVDNEI